MLAFENSKRILGEVKKPKALGDIRGVSYVYPILWRFGLIRVPEAIEKKMGKQRGESLLAWYREENSRKTTDFVS